MYRPKVQYIIDYVFSLLAICLLSVRMEWFDFEELTDDKDAKKAFDDAFPKQSELILVFYFLKPFVMMMLSKYRGMTNQSYFTHKMFSQRCLFDFFFYVIPCIYYYQTDKMEIGQALILTLPMLICELVLYFISIRKGN